MANKKQGQVKDAEKLLHQMTKGLFGRYVKRKLAAVL